MKEKILKLLREMFLYGVIGIFSASMDTLSYYLLNSKIGLYNLIANFIAVNIGICISFFLNTYLNFRKTDELRKRALKFFFVGYLGLGISTAIMWLGVDVLCFEQILVKVGSVFVVAAIQYLLNKFITFGK